MKRIVVTGAGGFVGTHLCKAILKNTNWYLIYTDKSPCKLPLPKDRAEAVIGDLYDVRVQSKLLLHPVDALIHLAALPGGAAEANPAMSKRINLDTSLYLFEQAARFGNCPRVVYASTIAVLGSSFNGTVTDDYCPDPDISYGFHKAMVELAINDMSRRNLIDGLALRLPGIVARPQADNDLKSAFMSDLFYKLKQHQPYEIPVSSQGSVWLMSVQQCVQNLLHGVSVPTSRLASKRNMTLPCSHVSISTLVDEIALQTGASTDLVDWGNDAHLQKTFANYPALKAEKALDLGFAADSDLSMLVKQALALC